MPRPLWLILSGFLAFSACGGAASGEGASDPDRVSESEYDVARDLWLRRNSPREALEHALKAVELNEDNADAAHLVALIYMDFCSRNIDECRLPEAEKHARLALKAKSDYREASNTLGVILIHEKRYADAIKVLKALTEDILYQTPENAWGNLGWAQLESGATDAAIESLRRSIAAQPLFCVGLYRLGLAYERPARTRLLPKRLRGHWKRRRQAVTACKSPSPRARVSSCARATKTPQRATSSAVSSCRERRSLGKNAAPCCKSSSSLTVPPMPTVGQYLRELREQRKMSVEEVSRVTRMPMASVERIETDRFDELPGEVFVRGFLKSYARSLGVPADDVLARYTASRRVAWVTPLPISAPSKPARGRRLGVAVAFVLLLILFTLALSIVLKPRGDDMPQELSDAAQQPLGAVSRLS
jgi:Tfp pilus assembly protein PilF/transcriptional regulator with XRE-family HTH domain